jgi:hypothetical protein
MSDKAYAPVCGLYCGECPLLGKQCTGCGNVEGRPFWTSYMKDGICPLHDCCQNTKKLEHCGLCEELPCKVFNELRDPDLSDQAFAESLSARVKNLKARKKAGTGAWLKEMAIGRENK